MKDMKIYIKKILFCVFLATLIITPTMFVKAQSNVESPKTIESFKVDNTKEECSFTYNLEEATEWMFNITGIKKNEQTIPMSKCIINIEDGTITIKTTLSENDKIAISAEGYRDVTFIVQSEHLFNIAWKHDENTHWKECMVKDCAKRTEEVKHTGGQATCQKKAECEVCGQEYGELGAHNYGNEWKHDGTSHWRECQTEGCTDKTDVAVHSGGQATCQKKAECEVCGQEYGELGAHNYGSEWKHDETSHWRECQTKGCTDKTDVAKHSGGQATYQKKAICSVCKVSYGKVKKEDKAAKVATQIKKLDVKVSNLTMKKISEVQAARKAYNALSKKEKDTIKKEVSTLTKAEILIKQNNCGTNVYYRFSNNTLTVFGKGAMKNCFTGSFTSKNIKSKIKNRIYQKYVSKVVNVVVEQGVTKIGNGAFACMPKLKTAQIQGTLGTAAFWGCANLEKVTYTNGKGTMGFACFGECKKLKNMVIAEGVSSMDRSCFAGCIKLKTIELPTTLKVVGETTFHSCSSLRTVTVKGRVTKCKIFAFYKVKNCKIILKTKAAKKSKKVFAKELKQEGNKKVKIK
ncbi:leucine-rich repeat domain-containing protein [Anaerobutyricum hallii]|uniref:Leucine-rich repeat domain-containing protein n=1 Tax=Anaerobutyricum hallii TaxID=39488 RepID=A0A414B7H9_9FIRM|nr:leucine-rich repeat domain-containing protein [Anaerobutyricum hallii]RHC66499.1 leucine-rich repeat domain-containing protein [Anaerobutyricum hallii]